MTFDIIDRSLPASFLIENESFEGVKRIGKTVAGDITAVCGDIPAIHTTLLECRESSVVLMATVDHSPLLDRLCTEHIFDASVLRGKREIYQLLPLEDPFPDAPQIRQLLVIAGSDKRGTIYGMFHLSELCGVSPLVFWGDAVPMHRDSLTLSFPAPILSKEPSVKYRGFFINDEWPAFGGWCNEKFGGVNANAYEKIFELLLRLKGNYLWPAMWRSSFSDDGPGLASAELADSLGVIMGTSHHEPLCRAGLEWQRDYKQYGNDSTWSFITNSDAITRFWEDGVQRNRAFENVITIGMRGENDSKLLAADATLADNINVIQKAILAQDEILQKAFFDDLNGVPRMLAIYKEVEDYYNGDATCPGLKDWDELSNVIFLLSDDNYGNLRNLPDPDTVNHPGGFGMYYHFDYHGAPTSYEWMNCNRLTKTWEQMTQAYEAGVREMWIVNVGDIKGVEYPLCYFLELAYDYDTWGISAPNRTEYFMKRWIAQQFGSRLSETSQKKLEQVINGYTKWNAIRSPESMNAGVYNPTHFRESERVATEVSTLLFLAEELRSELSGDALQTYESTIHYSAVASFSTILACVYSGINKLLAKRGCLSANHYADLVKEYIRKDQAAVQAFHTFNNGKWNHFMSSAHVGFQNWDDNHWAYPTAEYVTPIFGGKTVLSFRGSDAFHVGAHWQDRGPLRSDDMTRNDTDTVLLDLDSRGEISYSYEVICDSHWLSCEEPSGHVSFDGSLPVTLHFHADKSKFSGREKASALVRFRFDNDTTTFSHLEFEAESAPDLPEVLSVQRSSPDARVFLERQGYCCIPAKDSIDHRDLSGHGFRTIEHLGREGSAIKAFPPMAYYPDPEHAPYVSYEMVAETDGDYAVDLYLMARNPVKKGERCRFWISANDSAPVSVCAVSEKYYTEWFNPEWAHGVIDHARIISAVLPLRKGLNEIRIYAGEPGVIIEKIILHPKDKPLPESLLGPTASCSI
ncbi:MAG: glycosyl hydrolase 115 family protein [Lachnospiraceae bacterium]|nr:glycosyl hydrolase 115 family protein [Lachnospiraceae bacterium]